MNIAPKIALESIHFMQNSQVQESPLAKKIRYIVLPILAVLFALWAYRDTISNYFQVKQIKSNINANPLVQQVNQSMIKDFSDIIQKDIYPTLNPKKWVKQWLIDDIQSAKLLLTLNVPSTQALMHIGTVMKRNNGQCFDKLSFKDKLASIFKENVKKKMSSSFQSKNDLFDCEISWIIIMKSKNDDFYLCSKDIIMKSKNDDFSDLSRTYSLSLPRASRVHYTKDQFSKFNAILPNPIVDSQMEFI